MSSIAYYRAKRISSGAICAAMTLIALLAPQSTFAQSYWELSPYKIEALVAVEPTGATPPESAADLASELAKYAEAVVGPPWEFSARAAAGPLAWKIARHLDDLVPNDVPDELLDRDKIFAVAVRPGDGGLEVAVREFDVATRRWGLPVVVSSPQPRRLGRATMDAVLDAFAPIALIQTADDKSAVLELRAGALPPRDPSLAAVRLGDVFLPVVRQNDRQGNPRPDGIQPIPWTFLDVGSLGEKTECVVKSGLSAPLAGRPRGRIERYALMVRPSRGETTLRLVARTDQRPLAGYAIFARVADGVPPRLVGLTNRDGQLTLSPGENVVEELYIKHGDELLARFYVVPGVEPRLVVPVPDDDARLEIEGQIAGLRESLIDLAARREVLIARIRGRIELGDYPEAEKLMTDLRRLPTREQFGQRLTQIEQQAISPDPNVQKKIDALVQQARAGLSAALDPAPIMDLEDDLRKLKSAAAGG